MNISPLRGQERDVAVLAKRSVGGVVGAVLDLDAEAVPVIVIDCRHQRLTEIEEELIAIKPQDATASSLQRVNAR